MNEVQRLLWRKLSARDDNQRSIRTATITSITGNQATISLSGKALSVPIPVLANLNLAVGNQVRVEIEDNVPTITGKF